MKKIACSLCWEKRYLSQETFVVEVRGGIAAPMMSLLFRVLWKADTEQCVEGEGGNIRWAAAAAKKTSLKGPSLSRTVRRERKRRTMSTVFPRLSARAHFPSVVQDSANI